MNVIRKCSKKLTLSCALAVLAVVAPLQVSAQSVITIDEAETMTNGGNPVADGDSIIVTDTGSIATVGSVDAILVNDGNTITNSGVITAQGAGAEGIQARSATAPMPVSAPIRSALWRPVRRSNWRARSTSAGLRAMSAI